MATASSSVFRPGASRGPLVVAEVGVGHAGGDDRARRRQPVAARPGRRVAPPMSTPTTSPSSTRTLRLPAQDPADRRGDVGGRQPGGGHLIQQRLEDVVVVAIDDGDVDRRAPAARARRPARRSRRPRSRHVRAPRHSLQPRLPHESATRACGARAPDMSLRLSIHGASTPRGCATDAIGSDKMAHGHPPCRRAPRSHGRHRVSARLSRRLLAAPSRSGAAASPPSTAARTNPVTSGYICAKVRRFDHRVYGDDRLHFPAVRVGPKGEGTFRRVSWNDALDLRRRALRRPSATSPAARRSCRSATAARTASSRRTRADAMFFRRLGAARLAAHGLRGADRRGQRRALRQDGRRSSTRTTPRRG